MSCVRKRRMLWGRSFLKEFHKYYLGMGAVPFAVLEDRLDQWIEEQKK